MNDVQDMDEVDRRITDALHAAAAQVDEHSLRPALSPRSNSMPPARPIRWAAPVLAAAAVVAVVVGTVGVTSTSSSSPRRIPVGSNLPSSILLPSTFTSPPTPSSSLEPQPLDTDLTPSRPPTGRASAACPFGDMPCSTGTGSYFLPIWPFGDYKQADAWRSSGTTGSASWHEDAAATAKSYVQNVLGFSELDDFMPISARATSNEAYVTAGYMPSSGMPRVFATLHLVRYGLNTDSPWEIVGTEDNQNDLTIDQPAYGKGFGSPVPVSGTVTGGATSVVVTIINQQGEQVAPAHTPDSAGDGTAWRTEFSFDGTGSGATVFVVVAVAVSPGVTKHGPFAIQAFYH